jgi:hypothetical protein
MNSNGIMILEGCLKCHQGEQRLYQVHEIKVLGEPTEQTVSAASGFLD